MRENEADFSQREIDTTLALLIDTRAWIQRRTDKVELLDTYTLRRTIQFEIELPEWAIQAARSDDCRLILPIAVFGGGQALRNLDVQVGTDPGGTLTRGAADLLTRLLRERLKKNGDLGIPDTTRGFLDTLLGIKPSDSTAEATAVGGKTNYILFVTSDKSITGINEAAGSRFVVRVTTDQTLVRELNVQPAAIGKTLSAMGLLRSESGSDGTSAGRGVFSWLGKWWQRVKGVIWPSDTAFIVAQTISGFGDSESWQLEIYAPEELRITDGALIWWLDGEMNGETDEPLLDSLSGGSSRPTRRASSAVALTRFRVRAESITDMGLLIIFASAALLAVAVLIAVWGTDDSFVDAVVAILVIAPSLGASIVTNPESHEMAGAFLRPFRQKIYLAGFFAAFGAASFIVYGLRAGRAGEAGEVGLAEVVDMQFPAWPQLAFAALVLSLILMVLLGLDLWWFRRDLAKRNRLSAQLLSGTEKDISLKVFRERNSDGILETISTDAIDLGPRAVFRMPSRSTAPEARNENQSEPGGHPYSLPRRFFVKSWREETLPAWFFWASDIEADFTPRPDDGHEAQGSEHR